ncbi:MAG: alpha-ketoacid dehydrogenase subunit beta [Rhodospirillaceae bacterium]|nr:alpha-ketoacid dehydrogenase subunit beta [Rhodospirillaceae bacterium]
MPKNKSNIKPEGDRILSTSQAINEALAEVGARNKDVLLFAEGIDDPSAVYGTTKDLRKIYGDARIIEMPVAENGLCGVAIGASICGKRPVISFHRVEFALLAMEQIVNNAAKMHYASNGQHKSPIVIRLVIGRGWGQGPQHSQSLETLFASIPGLKVLMPVFPGDTKGMLIAAVEDNNPTIIIEHRWCHYVKGHVDEGYYTCDISSPKQIRKGNDVTIASTSYSTLEAIKACDALNSIDIHADLFDMRSVSPLNVQGLISSVEKTGRIMTVDIGHKTYGIGAEIIASVLESTKQPMNSNPVRIALPDHPVPSSRGYIPGLYPDANKIVKRACEMVGVEDDKINYSLEYLKKSQGDLPVDVPDPSFHGPF